jgi:hypothetical protein
MIEIKVNQNKIILIDDEDFQLISQYNWTVYKHRNTYYADRKYYSNGKRKKIKLHRLIMNAEPSQIVDHIDGNGLNNQRSNLRFATHQNNTRNSLKYKNNTSGYKGVHWCNTLNKWRAQIFVDKKRKRLGAYTDIKQAHIAYETAAKELFGEFYRENK